MKNSKIILPLRICVQLVSGTVLCFCFADHWFAKCIYPPTVPGGISRSLHRDGIDGCKPVSSHQHGPGPRENVVSPLPDTLRNQASSFSRNHPQSKQHFCKADFLTHCRKSEYLVPLIQQFKIYKLSKKSNYTSIS